jgi:hypothetical protein
METQLKKLQQLDDLETNMMKSMQRHVDTNNTLRQVQDDYAPRFERGNQKDSQAIAASI